MGNEPKGKTEPAITYECGPYSQPTSSVAVKALVEINIHQEVEEYEWRGDGDYTPNENERALLEDFGNGLIATVQERMRAALSAASAKQES